MKSETKTKLEWPKNAADHRTPNWPLGGYAPGQYLSKCLRCGGQFAFMDKRATSCLPCAIDSAKEGSQKGWLELDACKKENEILRAAIKIVSEDRQGS